jgi:hypothetical protein
VVNVSQSCVGSLGKMVGDFPHESSFCAIQCGSGTSHVPHLYGLARFHHLHWSQRFWVSIVEIMVSGILG